MDIPSDFDEKLKQFVQKNRSILTKAGTIKNLTDELIS